MVLSQKAVARPLKRATVSDHEQHVEPGTQHDSETPQHEVAWAAAPVAALPAFLTPPLSEQPQPHDPPDPPHASHVHESQVQDEHVQSVQVQRSPQQQACDGPPPVAPSMDEDRTSVRAIPRNMVVSFQMRALPARVSACEKCNDPKYEWNGSRR